MNSYKHQLPIDTSIVSVILVVILLRFLSDQLTIPVAYPGGGGICVFEHPPHLLTHYKLILLVQLYNITLPKSPYDNIMT